MKQRIYESTLLRKLDGLFWFFIDVVATMIPFFSKLVYDMWLKMESCVRKEIITSNICKDSRVLIVGCGPFPSTAVIIARMAKAKIVAIDNKKLAVTLAKKYLVRMGLKNVLIYQGDGRNFPVSNFDVIVINSSVNPRKEVLDNIFKFSKKGSVIVCREPKFLKNELSKVILQYKGITIKELINHPNNWCSYIVVKEDQ